MKRLVRKKKFGRHGWDYTLVFKYLPIKQACNLTYRDLEEATGIHNSTFVKAKAIFAQKQVFIRFFRHLVRVLITKGLLAAEYVAIDGSFVQTYSKRKEEDSAWWGKTEAHGFKLHALVDAKSEVPIAIVITDGKVHDSKLLVPLCKKLDAYHLKPSFSEITISRLGNPGT